MLSLDNAVLVVVDFQDGLLPKIHAGDAAVDRSVKLIRFARQLDVPIVWTEQYPKGLGPTNHEVAAELDGLEPIEKVSFGCFGEPAFVASLAGTKRKQLLVVGIETHVCVLQTVLAGMDRGYEAFVARDAVGSRHAGDYEAGLDRMAANGAQIVTVEMAMFEILRQAGTPEFKKILPLIK